MLTAYVVDTGNTQTSFTDTSTSDTTRYVYRVKAWNQTRLGERSNFVRLDR